IRFDNKENKDQLINLLETQLAEDMKKAKIAHNQINSTYKEENHHIFDMNKFPLNSDWALKANQNNRYTAQDMYDKLVQHVLESKFKVKEVPKVATIQNWISCYTREHKQKAMARKSN
ncbi:43637_t:CDS:2, partial [Gigaspora margarita]